MNDPLEIPNDANFEVKTESKENQFDIKSELVEEIKFDTESSLNASHVRDNKLNSSSKQMRKVRGSQSAENAEAKKERNREKSRKSWAGLSEEKLEAKRKRQRERAREHRAGQSDDHIEERRKRQRERARESFAGLSEEKLEAQRKRQRERAREFRAGQSDDQIKERRKRQRERARESFAGLSEEKLEAQRKRQRERAREVRAGQNEEEAAARKKRSRERARTRGSERTEDQYQEETKLRAKRVKLITHKVFSCDVCERKFSDTNNLNKHNRSHFENYFCAICDKSYTLIESLKDHIKVFHAEGYPNLEDGIGEFKCNLCSETFTQTREFTAHKKSHSKETKILYTTEFKLKAVKQVREVGVSKAAAELSINSGTLYTWFCLIFNPVYCTYCSKIFADQASLNIHEETHTKDPLYCAYCSKSFAHKGSLKAHENTHMKEENKPKKERIRIKKYSCNQCFKMFLRPGHLERHLRNFNGCAFKSELTLRELYFQKYDAEEEDAMCTNRTKEMMENEGLMEGKKEEYKSLQDSNQDGQGTEGRIKANNDRAEDNYTNFATEENTSSNYQEERNNVSNSNTDTLASLNDNDDMTDEETFVRDMAELGNSKYRGTYHEACDSDEHASASDTEATCLVKIEEEEEAEDVTEENIHKREMGYIDQLIKVEENSFKPKIENGMEENEDDHINDRIKLEDDLGEEINKQVDTIKLRKKDLKCDKCSRLFLKPSKLIRHKETSVYISNSCTKVKIKNNRDKELEHIKQVDGTFQCTLCRQAWETVHTTVFKTVYKTLNQTVNHVKSCHPEVNPQYQCEICAKQFYFPTKYNSHMKTHIEKEDGTIKGHDGQELVKIEATCHLCGKGFACKRSVKNHMFAAHTSKEEKDAASSFVCSFCAKGFCSKDGLQEHERLHVGAKNIKCPICPKSFNLKASLRSHVRKLHNESGKPFMSEEKKAKYKAYMVKYNAKYNAEKRAKKAQDSC